MHEVLANRLGGLGLPRESVVRLTDRPDMTLYVYRGRKTTIQQQQQPIFRKTDFCDRLEGRCAYADCNTVYCVLFNVYIQDGQSKNIGGGGGKGGPNSQ